MIFTEEDKVSCTIYIETSVGLSFMRVKLTQEGTRVLPQTLRLSPPLLRILEPVKLVCDG